MRALFRPSYSTCRISLTFVSTCRILLLSPHETTSNTKARATSNEKSPGVLIYQVGRQKRMDRR